MASQQIKSFVGLRQIDQVSRFETVSDEQVVRSFRFTERLTNSVVRLLEVVASGRGAMAIVGERGVGKSHVLSLVKGLSSQPFIVSLVESSQVNERLQQVVNSQIPSEGISTLTIGFDPEKGLNFLRAFPKVPGFDGELPPKFSVDQIDELIERRISRSETFAIFVDGISPLLAQNQQLFEWLSYLAKEAQNGRFALIVTLNSELVRPGAQYATELTRLFQNETIDIDNYVQLIAQHICCKSEQQFRALNDLYDDLRGRMPHFTGSREAFIWLYPLHPVVLEVAASMRRYAKTFSLIGFITGVGPRALVRRAMNLICLDDLFESFEFDIRKNPELAPIFTVYDRLFGTVIPRLGQHSLYGRLMLKSLLLLSLQGRPVTAMDIADGVMLYDERALDNFTSTLEAICKSIVDGSAGEVVCESVNGRNYYIFKALKLGQQLAISEALLRSVEEDFESETQLLRTLKVHAESISNDDTRLSELLIASGGSHFKDWPFAFTSEGVFKGRTELNLKWMGSLRKGIFKVGGENELRLPGNSTEDVDQLSEYDWQVILHKPGSAGALPPGLDMPPTLIYWLAGDLSEDELMTLKHLLVIKTEGKAQLPEEQYRRIVAMLESEVSEIFSRVYLQEGLFLGNQWSAKKVPYQLSSFVGSVLSRLLDEPLSMRYPCHPEFDELLDPEAVEELLKWMFTPTSQPTPDQVLYLQVFARTLQLVQVEGESYVLTLEREFPEGSPVRVIQKALEKLGDKPLSKQQAYRLIRREPYGMQRPALLLILGALAAGKQVILTDEAGKPIHNDKGLLDGVEIGDVAFIYNSALRNTLAVSWKDKPKRERKASADYRDHTLLIVDDDPGIHAIVQLAARPLGCKTLTALDGVKALELLRKEKVNLVISDMRMPNMTGVDLFYQMQLDPGLRDIPFIVLTSVDNDEEVANALDSGVEDYWIKPFRVQEITARIRRLFQRSLTKSGAYSKAAFPEEPQPSEPQPPKLEVSAEEALPVPPAALETLNQRFATRKITRKPGPPPIPHPPVPGKKEKKAENPKPKTEELTIPTITAEMKQLSSETVQFEVEKEGAAVPASSELAGTELVFSIKLSNPDNAAIDVMLLYNQYWDACRRVGKDQATIPEYEEFKSMVSAKTAKLKKQFNCEEIIFFVKIEGAEAYVDCQVNKLDGYLKKQPKFRLI